MLNNVTQCDQTLTDEEVIALSPAQHLVWLGQAVDSSLPLYNLAVTYTINGHLDVNRFTTACDLLIASSDILQSVVVDPDAVIPNQKRHRDIRADCEQIRLENSEEMLEWVKLRSRVALDPQRKVFDCALLSLPNKQHVFYWCQHHISSDGYNIELIIRYLSDLYQQLGNNDTESAANVLAPIPPYYDFIAELQEHATAAKRLKSADYWQAKSAQDYDIPVYFGKAFDFSHAKCRRYLSLESEQKHALDSLLKQSGFRALNRDISLFVSMATTMLVTGYRLHGKSLVNLGFPSHARTSATGKRTLGMMTGIGFLQIELDAADTFRTVARKIMRDVIESFGYIESGIQTKQSQAAYSSAINVLKANIDTFASLPVSVDWHYPGCSDSNSQLDLNIIDFEGAGNFSLCFDMAESVFSVIEQNAYLTSWSHVLNTLLDNPDQEICRFSMLDSAAVRELEQLESGRTPSQINPPTLLEHFALQAKRKPDVVAVKQGQKTLTFAELDSQANAIAAYLIEQGVEPGQSVAACFNRCLEMYPALLGIFKARAVYVPLDPTYPSDRLAYMVSNSESKFVLSNKATPCDFTLGTTVRIEIDTEQSAIDASWERFTNSGQSLNSSVPVADAMYIMYTSGSTGLPKGVVGTHSATLNRFAWMWRHYPFQPDEICCQKTALSFVDSIWELFGPLFQGVPVVVIQDNEVLDIFKFVNILEFEQITRLVLVPSFLSVLLDSDANVGNRLRAMEVCIVSGEALPMHVATSFLNKLGHCRLLNLYGSTEVTADVTADEVTRDKIAIKMPIGRPIDGVNIILADDHMNKVPKGAVGEICVTGAGLSGGYFANDELNAEKFIANPFGSGKLFKTGDFGRFNASNLLEHHGRKDAQIKIRGHRIESAEIENTVLQFAGIKAAILFIGNNDQLIAFYTVGTEEHVDEKELACYLEEQLPDFMLPHLVKLMQIPLLANGKVNRKALEHLAPNSSAEVENETAPRTPTEEVLVDLWKKTLGLAHVNIFADFFDIGGNSIAAMRIMVGARKAGFNISLKQILDIGNIAEIGSAIDSNPLQHLIKTSEKSDAARNVQEQSSTSNSDEVLAVENLLRENSILSDKSGVSDMFHLTATQKGILFHLLLQGEDEPLYLAQIRCDLVGKLDFALFQQAWNILAERHDVMRSVILHEGLLEPVQVIIRNAGIELQIHDFSHLDGDEQLTARNKIAELNIDKPISLRSSPMMRVTLVRMSDNVAHLILDWHHILMDGWSLAVVSNEVLLIYSSLKNKRPVQLPEAGKFRDHVIALIEQDHNMIQHFWRDKLNGFTVATPISIQSDKSAQLFARSNINVHLDRDSSERIYEFARNCRVTPNTVIQAAWSLLLSKYCDTDDVLFGFAVTGRSSGISNYESTIGMFVNSLPMRLRIDANQSLAEWLRYAQNEQMELVHYENSSLVDIQRASQMPANAPMFDSLLVFQNVPSLTVSTEFPLEIRNRTVHENNPTPITIEVFPGYCLELQVMYIEELFTDYPVEQVVAHFTNIIKSISSHPSSAPVSNITMMDLDEIKALTESFNQTTQPYPQNKDVSDLVWAQAQANPDARALSFHNEVLSYQQLIERADTVCNFLLSRALKPGELVGVCMNRGIDLIVSMLAIMRSGAAYLPLDPDYPQDRIDYILSDASVALLITTSDLQSDANQHNVPLLCLDSSWTEISETLLQAVPHQATPDDLAYVIYTSGSTGMPKGVKITRRNVTNFLCSMGESPGICENDCLLAVTTVAFDIAVLELFLPLVFGASVDIASRDMTFDGHALAQRIDDMNITIMQATPTTWRLLLAAEWPGSSSLKALVGGEALPPDLSTALIPRVSSLWNMYGPTETTVWSTCGEVRSDDAYISIGKPIANTEILILDSNDNLCPVMIPGELCIGGHGVTEGYVNRDDLTGEKFVPHPMRPDSGERVYRTGDLARWHDGGYLECLGRIDSQVKLRGFRIELGEIESVLSEANGIDHAVVKLINDDGNEYLAAYMVPDTHHDDVLPNELTLRDLLREKLPLYMIPSTFMILESIPKTPNGKIDRKALPDPHSTTANLAELATIDVYELEENQPANDLEKTLSKLWETALRRNQISVNSNFFDLGGNSISAMQIMAACKKQNITITILDIFNLGTIRLLAEVAADSSSDTTPDSTDTAAAASDSDKSADQQSFQHASDDLQRIAQMLSGGRAPAADQ